MSRSHPILWSLYAAISLLIVVVCQCLAPTSQASAARASQATTGYQGVPSLKTLPISDSKYPHDTYSATTDLCAACHRAHSRDNHGPSTSDLSSDLTSDLSSELCYDCHTIEIYASDADELISTDFRTETINLHASHASYAVCTGCHDPHPNQQPFRLRIDETFAQAPAIEPSQADSTDDPSTYWQLSADGSTINCTLSCHGQDQPVTGARYPALLEAR